jgi:hypothetical protein
VRLKQALVSRVARYQSYAAGYLTKPAPRKAGNARFAFRKNKSMLFQAGAGDRFSRNWRLLEEEKERLRGHSKLSVSDQK